VAALVSGLGGGDRTPGRALRAVVAHRLELAVTDVGSDVAVGVVDPLFDLQKERIDDRVAGGGDEGILAAVARRDVARHRLVVAAGKPGCGLEALRQIEGFENLHDLLVTLHHAPSLGSASAAWNTADSSPGGRFRR
jgi:hypothetical protein